jgi:hypothetical protein
MTRHASVQDDVLNRGKELQKRIFAKPPFLLSSAPRTLFDAVRRHLTKATTDGRLTDSLSHIMQHVRLATNRDGFTIYGARLERANFARSRELPHFTRSDGAWFDFLITGRCVRADVEILAYSCELRFPSMLTGFPRFVRYDLNLPGHANEESGLRCHSHPGHDDIQAAAPFFEPLDILDLCVYGLTWPENLRAN